MDYNIVLTYGDVSVKHHKIYEFVLYSGAKVVGRVESIDYNQQTISLDCSREYHSTVIVVDCIDVVLVREIVL